MASPHTPEGGHPAEGEGGSTKPASPFFFHHDARQREGRAYDLQPPRTIYPLVKTAHLDFGVEEVAVGSEIPWHHHDDKEEVIFVWRGHGRAYINAGPDADADVESSELQPGITMYVPPRHRHRLVNTGAEPLWIAWTFAPPRDGFEAALIKQRQSQPPQ